MTDKKTEYYKFTGKSEWAKVYEADEFRGSRNFKINVYLDDDSVKLYKKSGIQSKLKENAEGTFASFKRPETKLIKGIQKLFSPPTIYDKDGNELVSYKKNADNTGFDRVGDRVLIGNGSTVEVTVSVYPTDMGPGQRLESIRIIDLIEYTDSGGPDRDDTITVGATNQAPVKAPW